ncbi:hypothetical protein F4780DRAFT_782367 [Xylariomycetidae sp. FL0641]|nr:hypothetical protein F4780DRAFT_782367 [Xylariomycetidae sp. FL0641]
MARVPRGSESELQGIAVHHVGRASSPTANERIYSESESLGPDTPASTATEPPFAAITKFLGSLPNWTDGDSEDFVEEFGERYSEDAFVSAGLVTIIKRQMHLHGLHGLELPHLKNFVLGAVDRLDAHQYAYPDDTSDASYYLLVRQALEGAVIMAERHTPAHCRARHELNERLYEFAENVQIQRMVEVARDSEDPDSAKEIRMILRRLRESIVVAPLQGRNAVFDDVLAERGWLFRPSLPM